MWNLTLSLLLAGPAGAETPAELLKQGMAAQRAHNVDGAIRKYEACLKLDPEAVGCHWEIGWSHWTRSEWDQVVAHWEQVKALDPAHAEVDKHLPSARAQRDAKAAVARALAEAPKTVRPPVPAGKTVRIRAVGDLMIGSDFPEPMLPPDDAAHIFDDVRELLKDADVTFGNLEGPLCDGGSTNKCKEGQNCYAFRTPTRLVSLYRDAGFDLMSTANNHAEDFGVECRMQTEAALKGAGIAYSGRPGTTASVTANGVKVGMIGFHTSKNSHYVNDHEAAIGLVKALKASHDLVIVSFHGGAEGSKAEHVPDEMEIFYGEQRGHLRAFARAVIGAGADLVLGHGPHVLRGMEVVDGHLVVYSLGNFATYGRFNLTGPLGLSAVLDVTLDHEGRFVAGKILPVKQIGEGVPQKDASGEAIGKFRVLSEADFGSGAPLIAQDGTIAPRVR
jgi:tetratricopeptide (TPR) repeat protein